MTKFYVATDGTYLGGFDGCEPPNGSVEVQGPPQYGSDKWINGAWVQDPAAAAERARIAGVDSAIAGDATVAALKAMSSAEFDAWWTANVTNLTQASTVLKRVTRLAIRKLL